ncbi:MAG: glycosyltransferase family 4 protein, partial [Bacteroidales bacterium]|nr:glycosyltransferase family 4 protein [Bacteroidales bacterium]
MKIIYCIASVYNPGGMERVLLNKVRWLSERDGYEVAVVTTDQQGRPPFYAFPEKVRMTDLGINYSVDNGRAPIAKIISYFHKRRRHRKALTELLLREKADIVVSLYPSESSFIPSIRDGSK